MYNINDNWNAVVFSDDCRKIQMIARNNNEFVFPNSSGYDLTKKLHIYEYIADIVLEGYLEPDIEKRYPLPETVRGWSKPGANGPDKSKPYIYEKLEKFFYGDLKKLVLEKEICMDKTYSDFIKTRLFDVHLAMHNYLDSGEDEEIFWEMQNVLNRNKVAIPEDIVYIIQSFITQYLEESLFGEVMRTDREGEIACLKNCKLKEMQNLKDDPYLQHWFQLRNMYDIIAEKYIKPILQG